MKYVVDPVPTKYLSGNIPKEGVYYCHMKGYDHIPVFGSIGTREQARKIARMMNESKRACK